MSERDPSGTGIRVLTTAAELAAATDEHPVAVLDVGAGFVSPAYAVGSPTDGAVVFHRRSDHGVPGSAALGTASGLATLLDDPAVRAWVTGGGNRHLSVPRGLVPVVAQRLDLGSRGGEWDWMWTRDAPPVVAGEEHVEVLGPADRDEAEAFLTEHSPRTHGQPFARPGQRWVAVRDPHTGALVAVGGSEPCAAGTPTLAGIAVETGRRGSGLGRGRHRPPHPAGGRRGRRLRAGDVRRQRRRPPALPPAGVHDRDGVDLTLVRGVTSA